MNEETKAVREATLVERITKLEAECGEQLMVIRNSENQLRSLARFVGYELTHGAAPSTLKF